MRAVILADPLDNQQAGIHHYTRNLIFHLGKLDKDAEYYILRRKRDGIFAAQRQVVVRNYRFPGYAALRMFIIIPWKIRKLRADIVVEPAHFGPFNLPAGIRRVTVIHDLTPILFPQFHRFHSQLLQRIFLRGILRRASLIITNSESTRNDVANFFPAAAEKTESIYLGRDERIAGNVSRSAPGSKGMDYFLYLGTIEPRKNLGCLLDAYRIFRDGGHTHKLVIAGSKGWKSKGFFRKMKTHPYRDDIIFKGYVERASMPNLYMEAAAFIFPSYYEGFGLPVVEAMSCGTPCLLSETSSLPEVGGEAALYFNPDSPEALAGLMKTICTDKDLRQMLSERSRLQAGKFSWPEHVQKFDAALRKLFAS